MSIDHVSSVAEPGPEAPASRNDSGGFLEWGSRILATGMLPGVIAGFIAGGVGSRVAMRVMALTSPHAARGLETDFGATVGEITVGGTLFLLIAGCVLGMLGGIAYVAIRGLLPGSGWVKGLVFGIVLLALVGSLLVRSDNLDFAILSPAGLAVAMFSALPVLYGLLFVPLVERLEPAILRVRRPAVVIVPVVVGLIPLVLAGGLGLVIVAAIGVVFWSRQTIGSGEMRVLRLAGSALVGALVLWRGIDYVTGVVDIL